MALPQGVPCVRSAGTDRAALGAPAPTLFAGATDDEALAEAQRRAERLVTLNDASRELTALRTVPEVCETIYAQTKRVIDCTVFYMGLFAPERSMVDIVLLVDSGTRYPAGPLPAHESLIGLCISSKAPVIRDTAEQLHDSTRVLTKGQGGPRSVMLVPMLAGDRVVGVISAQSYKERAYAGDDVQTMQSLANQAAVVIENARLYEQARVWISQLEAVQRLGMELNRLESVQDIALSVAAAIKALLPCDAYRIMLTDDSTQDLVPIAFGFTRPEYSAQSVESLRVHAGTGIAGWAAVTGESLVVGNTRDHPMSVPASGSTPVDESEMVVPMLRDKSVLGVLSLSKLGADQYTAEHLRLLRIFADQAATAIANAQLYAREQRRADRLKELDQMRRDFVSTVTHELRTPMTGILGFSETLLTYWDRMSQTHQKELVGKIQISTERLNRLVQDLLLATGVEAGTLSLSPARVDLVPQIQQAVLEVTSKYRGQEIRVESPTDPVFVYADAQRIQQVAVNLLDNAAKYSPEGSPLLIRWTVADDQTQVQVQDFGPGISKDGLMVLFTRFGKITQTVRAGHLGTGLGLYISKQLVEAMGGRIWVDTEPGRGSTFSFSLPLAHRTACREPQTGAPA